MIVLHALSISHIIRLKNDFLPYVLLLSYQLSEEASEVVMDYLFDSASTDQDLLNELILSRRYKLAQWVIRHRLRNHLLYFKSNIFDF